MAKWSGMHFGSVSGRLRSKLYLVGEDICPTPIQAEVRAALAAAKIALRLIWKKTKLEMDAI